MFVRLSVCILYAFLSRSTDCDEIRYRDRFDLCKEDTKTGYLKKGKG